MSLINDMLRDLSARQAANPAYMSDEVNFPEWDHEKSSRFFDHPTPWAIIFLSILLFFAIIGIAGWWSEENVLSNKNVISHKPLALSVGEKSIELFSLPPQSSLNNLPSLYPEQKAENVFAMPISTADTREVQLPLENNISEDNQQKLIYELIDNASRALALDRLTSPEEDNAWFYYQSLLKLDTQNPIAIEGIKKIVNRYIQMINAALDKQDVGKARTYFEKAKMVAAETQLSSSEVEAIAQLGQALGAHTSGENIHADANNFSPVAENIGQQVVENNSITVENPLAIVQSSVRVPNQDYIDEQTVNQAKNLVAGGQITAAVELLQKQIDQGSFPLSETYLLDIYLQEKNINALQTLLGNVSIADFRKAYYQARLLVLQGDNVSAITQLELHLISAKQDENFRSLLAGLYQREGYSLQAITAYRNLLQDFNPQPAYWLGLALALDAETQKQSAIYAYQKLLEFEAIDTQVADYAHRRITELSQ